MSFSLTMAAAEKHQTLRPGFTRSEGGIVYFSHGLTGDACFRAEQGALHVADEADEADDARLHGSSSSSTDSSTVAGRLGDDLPGTPLDLRELPTDTLPEAPQPGAAEASSLTARRLPRKP